MSIKNFSNSIKNFINILDLTIGQKIQVLSLTDELFYMANIEEVISMERLVRIHYMGWSSKHDESINFDRENYRLCSFQSPSNISEASEQFSLNESWFLLLILVTIIFIL